MNSVVKDLLLVQSFDLSALIEEYHSFFVALLPSVFVLAVLVEYFDRLEPFSLVKRAVISILVLTTVGSFYHKSISASMEAADSMLQTQKSGNILLMDMFEGIEHWNKVESQRKEESFYEGKGAFAGTLAFLKYHLFDSFVNDGFTVSIYFITKLCFLILKVVYSLVYYLGLGLIGIPCLIYLFPSMGNVMRGAILSYLWCLVVPHILVFIISMIGGEINKGYVAGQIIGGSMMGTAFLFILTLFVAFTPLIGAMILNGSGISQAGGIIASIGANYVMNLPKNTVNNGAVFLTGGRLGPKMKLASSAAGQSYKLAKGARNIFSNSSNGQSLNNRNHSTDTKQSSASSTQLNHSKGESSNQVNQRQSVNIGGTKPTNRKTSNYTQRQNTGKGEVNHGAIPKHGGVHKQTKTSNDRYRSDKRSHEHRNTRSRHVSQPTRR